MVDITLLIVICLMLPSAFLCMFLDSKGRKLILSLSAGLLACLFVYVIDNYVIAKYFTIDSYFLTTISPMFEELIKFIPIFALIMRKDTVDLKDVIGISFTVGVGFSVVENLYFLTSSISTASIIWMVFRCIGTGLMHSISSAIIGIALNNALKDKRLFFEFVLSAYFFSTMYHGLFNFLVQYQAYQVFAVLVPILSYLAISFLVYKNQLSLLLLDDEMENSTT